VRWFKPDALKTKKIPTVARDPTKIGKIPIQISITDSREDSIAEAENAKEEFQIFSDGSALEGKVGAAVVLIHQGRHTQTLYYHLGLDKEHTVHKVELVGILLRLHILSSRKSKKALAAIRVDNQAAIKAFTSDLRNPGHHLTREALCIASKISKERKKGGKNKHALTIRWTAGHEGIEGNELVDREAKEAAKGCTSDMKLLPCYLRKPVLTNSSTVKKAHNKSLTKEWQEEWRNLKQGKALTLFDESTPSSKFLKSLSNPKLSRAAASAVVQLRLTHFLLNGYLKRIGRMDNTRCPACRVDEEDITHFLLRC
jgi:ribonuclease HI